MNVAVSTSHLDPAPVAGKRVNRRLTPTDCDPAFATRYSRHGWGVDVRGTYAHLPCQPFWTWLTGKSLWPHPPRRPQQTWLSEWQLWAQIAWGYLVIVGSVLLASTAWNASWKFAIPIYVLCWVLVVNRTRGLLHTFHYMNHGATIANMAHARMIAVWFLSIPIMHITWDSYHDIHARDHHGARSLCTDADPDQQFMTNHGFRACMTERQFWTQLFLAPFHPANLWGHLRFRLEENFLVPSRREVAARLAYWTTFVLAVSYLGVWTEIALFLLLPLFVLTQFSSWIQHSTEHLWFPHAPAGTTLHVQVGAMTWGRFFGRPFPLNERGWRRVFMLVRWWGMVVLVDLPVRLFSFMQDLSCHDFHHRSPRVNFWSISQERRAHEGRPSKYGPMTETWSVWESWLVLRDHLCRGVHDPFGVYAWEASRRQSELVSAA